GGGGVGGWGGGGGGGEGGGGTGRGGGGRGLRQLHLEREGVADRIDPAPAAGEGSLRGQRGLARRPALSRFGRRARSRRRDRAGHRARLPGCASRLRTDLRRCHELSRPMTTKTCGPTLSASIVGSSTGPLTQTIAARWLMAYNAALTDGLPRPVAHPLFAVCYEWPVSAALREQAIDAAIAPLSVHASHHLVIHRPPRAGDRLTTTGMVTAVLQRRSGALVTMNFATVDDAGQPVTTTTYGSLYRGVTITDETGRPAAGGGARAAAGDKATPGEAAWTETVTVAANAAHVYTECARIWNPIHTDDAVARAAGLPGIILHGTATLALCITRIVSRDLRGDAAGVHGVSVRFTGMVTPPSTFVLRVVRPTAHGIAFDAIDDHGRPILSQGALSI